MAEKKNNGDNFSRIHGVRKKSGSRNRQKEQLEREERIRNPKTKPRSSINIDLKKVIGGSLDFDDFEERHNE